MEASKVVLSLDGQLSILKSVELQLENFQKRGGNFAFIFPNIEVKFVQIPHLDEPISFAVVFLLIERMNKFLTMPCIWLLMSTTLVVKMVPSSTFLQLS